MLSDPAAAAAMQDALRPRRRAGPWAQLLSELLELAGRKADLVSHGEQPWASATFSGARHTVLLAFAGAEAIAAGEALIDALPEHEFNLPRQIVADAAIISVDHTLLPEARMSVEIELLLLDDG